MPKSLSATIPDPLEARARIIARQENRSLSNVVENALGVFTALPKELRDHLVAQLADGGPDNPALREASRELMYTLARRRYAETREAIAKTLASQASDLDPALASMDQWQPVSEAVGQ